MNLKYYRYFCITWVQLFFFVKMPLRHASITTVVITKNVKNSSPEHRRAL